MAGRAGKEASPPRDDRGRNTCRSLRALLQRLDTAAGRANPFLLLIVIGLVILNLSCFTALRISRLPPPVSASAYAPTTLGFPYNR